MRAGLLILLATLGVTLGGLEAATRWYFAGLGSTGDNTSYFARQWARANEGGRNALGFREREVQPKRIGVTRIVVVGDSFTYGQGVRREERFTERLDQALGPAVDVLNFGTPGANYERHISNMALALELADPDIVLLQWLFNDVQLEGVHPPRPVNLAGPLHRFFQPYSAAYFIANRGFTQLQWDLGLAPARTAYYEQFADPAGDPAVAARARLETVLDLPRAAGLPHAIVLWPGSLADRNFTFDAALFDQVMAVCAARGVACLDLRPALTAAPEALPLAVSIYDTHPSAGAHAVAAEALLPVLRALVQEAAPMESKP